MVFDTPYKFGHYYAGDLKSFSKLEAFEWSKRFGTKFGWNFNEEFYDTIDWKKEPLEPLEELYKNRCVQIRNNYDYVVLWYSGGADSSNILDYWLKNNIKLDEIAIYWNYGTTKNANNIVNAEIFNVVLPKIKQLQKQGYDFKINLINYPDYLNETLNFLKNNTEYYLNRFTAINAPIRHLLRHFVKDWKKIIDSGKKMVFVYGYDKPMIGYENNKHYVVFQDGCSNSYYNQYFYKHGWFEEYFYWTPDYYKILLKQSHEILKFIKSCHHPMFYIRHPYKKEGYYGFGYNSKLNMYLSEKSAKKIIYPTWNDETFSIGKSWFNSTFSKRDLWFTENNNKEVSLYNAISHDLLSKYSLDKKNLSNSLLPCFSKKYYLE